MSAITAVILCFSLLGAVDFVIGNKIGVGKEFERAFSLFAPMSMPRVGSSKIRMSLSLINHLAIMTFC